MIEARKALLDVGRIQELTIGEISAEEAKKTLAQLGFEPKQQEELTKACRVYPIGIRLYPNEEEVLPQRLPRNTGYSRTTQKSLTNTQEWPALTLSLQNTTGPHWQLPSFTQGGKCIIGG